MVSLIRYSKISLNIFNIVYLILGLFFLYLTVEQVVMNRDYKTNSSSKDTLIALVWILSMCLIFTSLLGCWTTSKYDLCLTIGYVLMIFVCLALQIGIIFILYYRIVEKDARIQDNLIGKFNNNQFNCFIIVPVLLLFVLKILSLIFSFVICRNGQNEAFCRQTQSDSIQSLVSEK